MVTTLAGEMARRGLEVCVATLTRGEKEYPLAEGVRRLDVGLSEEEEKKGKIGRVRTRIRHLRDCLKKEKPDVKLVDTVDFDCGEKLPFEEAKRVRS